MKPAQSGGMTRMKTVMEIIVPCLPDQKGCHEIGKQFSPVITCRTSEKPIEILKKVLAG